MTVGSNCLDEESLIHELFTFHESDLHMKSKTMKIGRRITLKRIDDSHAIERRRACCIPCAVHLESKQILKSGRAQRSVPATFFGCVYLPSSRIQRYIAR